MRPFRFAPALLLVAAGAMAATLPSEAAGVEPRIVRSIPPSRSADPQLEEAIRRRLFDRPVDDGQGHGPDPGSQEWRRAKEFQAGRLCRSAGPLNVVHTRYDLNGDGRPERIATVVGSYTCGTGGCALLIFREAPGGLKLVTDMTLFRPPLVVSSHRTNGWNDLIFPVRIDAGHGHQAVLAFDGRSYPSNPSSPPAAVLRSPVTGTEILPRQDVLYSDQGQRLGCGP